ncbi:MAG TPA: EipA family protein [Steroidobacteraceae bacterium]|nr:EipA family protein [Steroidobacteraceae bacterium]
MTLATVRLRLLAPAIALCASLAQAGDAAPTAAAAPAAHETYSDDEVAKQASEFFSTGAKDLSQVLEKVLKEKGHPVAIIRGEEAGGAIGVGVRYGRGELVYKGGGGRKVYWQGPSIGFDVGANAVKTFILVYDLPNAEALFKRFPGVEGSLYFVGGFGVNYLQRGAVALAPVRFGVGWRQGIALSYINFSRTSRYNPF